MTFNDFTSQVRVCHCHDSIRPRTNVSFRLPVIPAPFNSTSIDPYLCSALFGVPAYHGVHPPLYVCRSDQGLESLGRRNTYGAQYDWLLESDHSLAQGARFR